jgi:hypothetical protein
MNDDVRKFRELDDGYFLDTGSPHVVEFVGDDRMWLNVLKRANELRYDQQLSARGCECEFC